MGGLTDNSPKCLARLGGKTLLELQMTALRAGGIERIAIVTGWQGGQLAGRGAELFENPRWAETNMVMSLACAAPWLRTGTCVVSYSDIFYSASAVMALIETPGDIAITYDPEWLSLWSRRFENPLEDAETFQINAEGRITDIGRRAASLDEIKGQYMGLLRFTPQGWAAVEELLSTLSQEARDKLDMTSLLQRLIKGGTAVRGMPISCAWGEVDSATDLSLYEADIRDGKLVI